MSTRPGTISPSTGALVPRCPWSPGRKGGPWTSLIPITHGFPALKYTSGRRTGAPNRVVVASWTLFVELKAAGRNPADSIPRPLPGSVPGAEAQAIDGQAGVAQRMADLADGRVPDLRR